MKATKRASLSPFRSGVNPRTLKGKKPFRRLRKGFRVQVVHFTQYVSSYIMSNPLDSYEEGLGF